jgi:hypothetical protein
MRPRRSDRSEAPWLIEHARGTTRCIRVMPRLRSRSRRPPRAHPRSFREDSWRNVYAGELEVRPAFALVTTKAVHRPVRRSHEVAKVEARSAKADLRESFGRHAHHSRAGGATPVNPRDGAGERRRTPSECSPYSKQLLCDTKAFVIKSRRCSRVSVSIRRLDEHGPMHRHVRTGGAERMNAGLVCGHKTQGRLQGEAR